MSKQRSHRQRCFLTPSSEDTASAHRNIGSRRAYPCRINMTMALTPAAASGERTKIQLQWGQLDGRL
jgi:hypothetical protein